MKTNSLGFSVEVVPPKERPAEPPTFIEVESSGPNKWYKVSTSTMLCCILTTLLVGAGIGIGVWFALASTDDSTTNPTRMLRM